MANIDFGGTIDNTDVNESIREAHCSVVSHCNKKSKAFDNNFIQNTLHVSGKETNRNLNFLSELKKMLKKYEKNITVDQININFLRNNSLPNAQFQINGYKCLRKDRDNFDGGLCLYMNEDIQSKQIHTNRI